MPRGWNAMERAEALLLAGQPLHALVHGCSGVGKTTELLRWREALAGRIEVIYTRLPLDGHYANSVGRALWAAMSVTERHGLEQNMGAQSFAERIVAMRHQPLLMLMDGGDLVDEFQAGQWFGPGGVVADHRLPSAIITAPHAWQLADGLASRLAGLDILETPDLLLRIARQSGGVPRYAVVLLRQAVLAAAGGTVVRSAHVLEAERELRQDLEQGIGSALDHGRPPIDFPLRHRVSGAILTYEGETKRSWPCSQFCRWRARTGCFSGVAPSFSTIWLCSRFD